MGATWRIRLNNQKWQQCRLSVLLLYMNMEKISARPDAITAAKHIIVNKNN